MMQKSRPREFWILYVKRDRLVGLVVSMSDHEVAALPQILNVD